ncbi:MAG: hypothetical protein JWM96_744 [Alphaproteobacteria bacterium]|nr:hypothetical protein [Alphaproteobacteria bacterium]
MTLDKKSALEAAPAPDVDSVPAPPLHPVIKAALAFQSAHGDQGLKFSATQTMINEMAKIHDKNKPRDEAVSEMGRINEELAPLTEDTRAVLAVISTGAYYKGKMQKTQLTKDIDAYITYSKNLMTYLADERAEGAEVSTDEFAAASLTLAAMTADLAEENITAFSMMTEYALALFDAKNGQDHFANYAAPGEEKMTNQTEGLDLMRRAAKLAVPKFKNGHLLDVDLIRVIDVKNMMAYQDGGEKAFAEEQARDAADIVLADVTIALNELEQTAKIKVFHSNITSLPAIESRHRAMDYTVSKPRQFNI